MPTEEIATLQATITQLEQDNRALEAKAATAENAEALKAAEARHAETLQAKQAEIDAAKAELTKANEVLQAANKKRAEDAVKAAIARGALPPKDDALQAKWRALVEADPSNETLLAALIVPAALGQGRIIKPGGIEIVREASADVLRAFNAETDPLKRGLFYNAHLRERMAKDDSREEVLMATDTYVMTLVIQRALELLKWEYPQLKAVTTDFSGEGMDAGGTIKTRTIGAATVSQYAGTYSASNAATTDVDVTMTHHPYVQAAYTTTQLMSSRRRLFDEQVETSYVALAKDMLDALTALILVATFTNTLDEAAANFDRASVIELGRIMTTLKNPKTGRTLWLNPTYFAKLCEDITVVSALVNTGAGSSIATGQLPPVHGFLPTEVADFPTTANRVGFAFTRSALIIVGRVPSDYTTVLPGAAHGSVNVVTNPEDGMSVMLVQYVDHATGTANWRIAMTYGVATGQASAGVLIRSGA
jgi:hypothetical protein